MVSPAHWPSLTTKPLLLLLAVLLLLLPPPSQSSPVSSCLRSCHHCKQMYGHHFSGHLCARSCLSRRGQARPICTSLPSIKSFLDLSSIADYDWADTNSL